MKKAIGMSLALCMGLTSLCPTNMQVLYAKSGDGEVIGVKAILKLNEKAVPRYSSVRIVWDAVKDHTYSILRKELKSEKYEVIAKNIKASEFIDENAGVGKIWNYKIKDNLTNEETEIFSNTTTGLHAILSTSTFQWMNEKNATKFDGKKVIKATETDLEKLKKLDAGTILMKGYLNDDKNSKNVLLGMKNNDKCGFFGTRAVGTGNGFIGFEMTDLISGWNLVFTSNKFVGNEGQKHMVGYVSPKTEEKTPMRIAIDGQSKSNNAWTSDKYGGFLKKCNLTDLSIGGFENDGKVTDAWNGNIDYVLITSEILSQNEINALTKNEILTDDSRLGSEINQMFDNRGDNSWVFTGGEEVKGSYSQTEGARNYIGQFEEYIRWTKGSTTENTRQRYTINAAEKGQTLKDINTDWNHRVDIFKPRAVSYMLGKEDYGKGEAGINDFKVQLKTFINHAISLKKNDGFVVIQNGHAVKNEQDNATIKKYNNAIYEVVNEFKNDPRYSRIVVVDHFKLTDNVQFKNNKIDQNGCLNQKGHLEIGKQLCEATIKTSVGYLNESALNLKKFPKAEIYTDVMPTVTSTNNSLHVNIPNSEKENNWAYILKIGQLYIEDEVNSREFTIDQLPTGKDYILTIKTVDGKKQLKTVKGNIKANGTSVENKPILNANQKAIKAKMDTGKSMTWLFMGDSITHGAAWTNGYDSIAQSFEKFIKEDLNRNKDVVINTAVSGAETNRTLNTIYERLDKYSPDVVSIMLGTNDCATSSMNPNLYKTNMKKIIDKAKSKGAIVVLRTPTPGARDAKLIPYIEKLEELAKEDPSLIYIDQFTKMKSVYDTFPYLTGTEYFYRDFATMRLHPNTNGHLVMTRQMIDACGLWTNDSNITNLFYQMPITTENKQDCLPVQKSIDKMLLNIKDVENLTKQNIGAVKFTAIEKNSKKKYSVTTKIGDTSALLTNLKHNTSYNVEVEGYVKNNGKVLKFNQEVSLSDSEKVDFDLILSQNQVYDLNKGAKIGDISVNQIAPEGKYTYTLTKGNDYFTIEGNELKIIKPLTEKQTYSICIKATNGKYEKVQDFKIVAVGSGFIFEDKNVNVVPNKVKDLTKEKYAHELESLEEGTIIIQYTDTYDYIVQSLLSVSNKNVRDRHFHIYVKKDGTLGFETRNGQEIYFHEEVPAKHKYQGKPAKNTIALKADKKAGQYKLFVNGELVNTINYGAGYKFIKDIDGIDTVTIGGTLRKESNQTSPQVAYPFGGTIHDIKAYSVPLSDEELLNITNETNYNSHLQEIFGSHDGTGANYFRIPALATLKDGTVVSSIDARYGGSLDSPNNIDIAFSRSTDGGKTWSKPTLPLHFADYADDGIILPRGNSLSVKKSASFIDSSLLHDEETGRLFLIADAMPYGVGTFQAQQGSGYKTINGKRYLMVKKAGDSDYHYSIHDDRYIYDDRTNKKTEYSVNGNYEILKNGVLQTVKQKSVSYDPTTANGAILTSTTDKDVAMNIMYEDATFKVYPTIYITMIYSDDQGKTWSDPIILNKQVKSDTQKWLINGPGRGLQIKNGKYKGRLVIPTYIAGSGAKCGIMYSDDHGENWKYADGPNTSKGVLMTESQIVEMPDGSLKVFARANNKKIAVATSLDGGETWNKGEFAPSPLKQPSCGSQISVINYNGLIDGKPAIILSSPESNSPYRRDGHIRIGLISDTGKDGYDKYFIDWKYDYEIDDENERYGYSCLTELPNHNIGVLYEKYDSYLIGERQTLNSLKYEELNISALRNKPTVEIIPVAGNHGTVSQRNMVDKGSKVTFKATPEEGYEFVKWTDEHGKVISKKAEDTIVLNETMKLYANFRKVGSDPWMPLEPSKPIIHKQELDKAIADKPAKEEWAYTINSWKAYQEALDHAKKVLVKEDATQKEIDDATKALQDAYKALEENPALTPLDPSTTVKPEVKPTPDSKPEGDKPIDSEGYKPTPKPSVKPETPKKPNNEKVENIEKPNTGVSTNTSLLWTMVLGAGVVAITTIKRRKSQF